MSRIAVLVLVVFAAAASAFAAPPPPKQGTKPPHPTTTPALSVTPARVPQGDLVSISGKGCATGDPVTILSAAFPHPAGKALGVLHATANPTGRFHARVHVPATRRIGRYPVTARCAGETLDALAWFRVV